MRFKNSDSSLSYDFAISDTASISKIFIADMKGNSISLDKTENNWEINNRYKVRNNSMEIILQTIKSISVQRPVSESRYNKVIKDLATNGVKIEIYQNREEKPTKTYTIGNNTADHSGTYMLLKNQEQPYIMHIIGFNGILGPRYGLQGQEVSATIWRDRNIFKLKAEEIKSLQLINEKGMDSSFTIKNEKGNLTLFDFQQIEIKSQKETLLSYLNLFQDINCESFKDESVMEKLVDEKKLYTFIIRHQNRMDSLSIYQMRDKEKPKTEAEKYTVERMYATLNSGDIMLIQNYVFNKLLITIHELKRE
tara:strand:- start:377 stop:1300 length:924 start_codon:yes stop_codon:yes gene_type:complete